MQKRRGRATKVAAETKAKAAPKAVVKTEKPKPPEVVNQHVTKLRCNARSIAYPGFMGQKCGHVMAANGTAKFGTQKRWKCPVCGNNRMTEAKQI